MPKEDAVLTTQSGPREFQLKPQDILPRRKGPSTLALTLICIAIAWGGPLVLCLIGGSGMQSVRDYLHDPTAWSKYVIAIVALLFSADMVIAKLRAILAQFLRAPLLSPTDLPQLAKAHGRALFLRNQRAAIVVCMVLAALTSWWVARQHLISGSVNWAMIDTPQGHRLTAAGKWANVVSLPLVSYLLYRGLWLHLVWSQLLIAISRMQLRLVVDHPDGKGGLAFAASYGAAHWPLVLALSAALSAALAGPLRSGQLDMAAYTTVVHGTLLVTALILSVPVLAFTPVLSRLKQRAIGTYAAQATRERRRAERDATGHNLVVDPDPCTEADAEAADAGKLYAAAAKLGTVLVNRAAMLPVMAAMLLPFAYVAATELPVKQIIKVLKGALML